MAPADKSNGVQEPNPSSQPIAVPGVSVAVGPSGSPATSLTDSPCQSPMFREEDEQSETGESEVEEDEDRNQVPGETDEYEVIQFDEDDGDMNRVRALLLLLVVVVVVVVAGVSVVVVVVVVGGGVVVGVYLQRSKTRSCIQWNAIIPVRTSVDLRRRNEQNTELYQLKVDVGMLNTVKSY